MQPFQGKKLKIPHRASSQQTDAALSRLQVPGCRMNLFPWQAREHLPNSEDFSCLALLDLPAPENQKPVKICMLLLLTLNLLP